MNMILRVSNGSGSVPPGSYFGTFHGVEPVKNDFGEGLKWQFKLDGKGIIVSRTTQQTPSTKNGCGRMLAGVMSKALVPDESVDLHAFIGKKYLLIVGQG